LTAAQAAYGNREYSLKHSRYPDKPIYKVGYEDIDKDGRKEVVIRKAQTRGNAIFMINGYKLVKSRRDHRHGYDELFPNKQARAAAKARGITRKNYEQRALKYNMQTGTFSEYKKFILDTRVKNLGEQLRAKMMARRLSIGDAILFFLFEPAWKCFSATVKTIVQPPNWKNAISKLLQIYVQAKRLTLRDIIISYGEFTQPEKDFFAKSDDTNEFLHNRGKLFDMIWTKFVYGLFDGDPTNEWSLLEAFIRNILKALPDIAQKGLTWLDNKSVAMNEDPSWGVEERRLEMKKIRISHRAIQVVRDTLKVDGMTASLLTACRSVNMGTKAKPVHFEKHLTNRMRANIVDVRGIKGGDIASKAIKFDGPRAEVSAALKKEAAAAGGDGTNATGHAADTPAAPAKSGETEPDFSKIGEAANELLGEDDDESESEPEVDHD
jgi:hypothetical protein